MTGRPPQPGPLERLRWLAGRWEGIAPGRVSQEYWMEPLGGTMVGMSRTVAGDRTVAWEHLRIEERGSGLAYIAYPSGQAETRFDLVGQDDALVVFENLAHDFPQRIRYRLLADGSLRAQIEGMREGALRVIDFPMKRIRPDASQGAEDTR